MTVKDLTKCSLFEALTVITLSKGVKGLRNHKWKGTVNCRKSRKFARAPRSPAIARYQKTNRHLTQGLYLISPGMRLFPRFQTPEHPTYWNIVCRDIRAQQEFSTKELYDEVPISQTCGTLAERMQDDA